MIKNDLNVIDLNEKELIDTEGGILMALTVVAAGCGILYLAGEVAEAFGRSMS